MSPSFPTANPPTHTVSFPARRLHGSRTFSSSDCHIRLHVFLPFYCGLKSPGVNSTLPPGSALCRYFTEPFLLLFCSLDYFVFLLLPPCGIPTLFCPLLKPQVVIGETSCVVARLHVLPQKYKMFWIRKHEPHLLLVRYNDESVNLRRDYGWNSKWIQQE